MCVYRGTALFQLYVLINLRCYGVNYYYYIWLSFDIIANIISINALKGFTEKIDSRWKKGR